MLIAMTAPDSVARPMLDPAGNAPDLPAPAAASRAAGAPIELPRVVMRGALAVALGGLLLALLLGLWRARNDMREELDAALVLARTMAVIGQVGQRPKPELLEALRSLQTEAGGPRHLRLRLLDGRGQALLPEVHDAPLSAPLIWLVALNQRVFAPPTPRALRWSVAWPDGEIWQLQLLASADAEQHEALGQLLELLGLLALGSAVMLAVMHWNVRRAFRPLHPLLGAIGRVEHKELAPLRELPTMPIGELEAIAAALRHLAAALEQAEAERRVLGQQVLSLQEDERSRLARELHDEFGQRLTALRVDAAWLRRRLEGEPELAAVVAGMSEQCECIQQEVRALLTRLRPLGVAESAPLTTAHAEDAARLHELLASLVRAWSQSPGQSTRYSLAFDAADGPLPRELVLAVYRISQEALTNVARHAQASQATLRVHLQPVEGGGMLHWSVEDDGCGLDAAGVWQRGNGLAGIKERVWALGGDLECQPAAAGRSDSPGLRLQALLRFATPRVDDVAAAGALP